MDAVVTSCFADELVLRYACEDPFLDWPVDRTHYPNMILAAMHSRNRIDFWDAPRRTSSAIMQLHWVHTPESVRSQNSEQNYFLIKWPRWSPIWSCRLEPGPGSSSFFAGGRRRWRSVGPGAAGAQPLVGPETLAIRERTSSKTHVDSEFWMFPLRKADNDKANLKAQGMPAKEDGTLFARE